MEPSGIKSRGLPKGFIHILNDAKNIRKAENNRLSTLSSELLYSNIDKILHSFSHTKIYTDYENCKKISIIVFTFLKIRKDDFPTFITILGNLNPEDEDLAIFISYIFAKLLKHSQRGFVDLKLDSCVTCFQNSKRVLPSAYFLYFLAIFSSNSILLCANHFISAVCLALFHQNVHVQDVGYNSLVLALKILECTQNTHYQPISYQLYLKAQEEMKYQEKQRGAFLIFLALFEYSYQTVIYQVNELMDFFASVLDTPNHMLALANLILLSPLNKEYFTKNYFQLAKTSLCNEIKNYSPNEMSSKSLVLLIRTFPELFQKLSNEILEILPILLSSDDSITLNNGFLILKEISLRVISLMEKDLPKIVSILSKLKITTEFVETIPQFIKQFPSFWDQFKPYLLNRTLIELKQSTSKELLVFLSLCPLMNSNELVSQLIFLLNSKNPIIRGYVPAALLEQIPYEDCQFVNKIFYKIFALALSDPDPSVRELAIDSFNEKCYPYLTNKVNFSNLVVLAHDTSIKVKKKVIQLIGKISEYDPFNCLPVIKEILLDALFILDSKRPSKVKSELIKLFPIIFKAATPILPIYCPTFCDIALRQLSQMSTNQMTYFEQKFVDLISIKIMKTIEYIASTDINLLSSHLQQFVNYFIWLLKQQSSKDLKLTFVTTLSIILTKTGPIQGIDIQQLFYSLTFMASRWNSKKLNFAVLKLIGLIGAIEQSSIFIENENSEIEKIQQNDPSYYMTCAFHHLISVIMDESLISLHLSALNALSLLFWVNDLTYGKNYFSEFMAILLDKIKNDVSDDLIKLLIKTCINSPRPWVLSFKGSLIELVNMMIETESSFIKILDLIPALSIVFKNERDAVFDQWLITLINFLPLYNSKDSQIFDKIIKSIISLRSLTTHFHFSVMPVICEIITYPETPSMNRYNLIETLLFLVQKDKLSNFSSLIIQVVIYCLQLNDKSIQNIILQVLYSLMITLESQFIFYSDQILQMLEKNNIESKFFLQIFHAQPPLTFSRFSFIKIVSENNNYIETKISKTSKNIDINILMNSLKMDEDETPWNWKEWYHQFVSSIILNCPSYCIVACSFLCKDNFKIAENIFYPAFLATWKALSEDVHVIISGLLTRPILSESMPSRIRASLVNLFEFMERNECHIQISKQVICQTCELTSQYTKAYYFSQRWLYEDPNNIEAIETFIRLSSHFGFSKTVIGMSKVIEGRVNVNSSAIWFEHIGQWGLALKTYQKQNDSLRDVLRCLKHEKRWDEIISKIPEFEKLTPLSKKQKAAPLIATALFHRQMWNELGDILQICQPNSVQVLSMMAMYQISQKKFDNALKTVEKGFDLLAQNSIGAFAHDKTALYPILVKAQKLHEISEIAKNQPNLVSTWENRLQYCKKTYDVYFQIISVRLSKFTVMDLMPSVLKMLKLALNQDQFLLFESTLNFLFPNKQEWPSEISFIYCKSLWIRGHKNDALNELSEYLSQNENLIDKQKILKSKMYYAYANWMIEITPTKKIGSVLKKSADLLEISMRTGVKYYNSWHRWAWVCSMMYSAARHVKTHAISAIQGFLECIKIRNGSSFSDLIQMIYIFFISNLDQESFLKITNFISSLSDGEFLSIIPQLFVQLLKVGTMSSEFASSIIKKLLPQHYHALLFPLLFESNPNQNFTDIIDYFYSINSDAMIEASTISNGLHLCSSISPEYWLEHCTNALRAIQKHNFKKAIFYIKSSLAIPRRYGDTHQIDSFREQFTKVFELLNAKNLDSINMLKKLYSCLKSYLNSTHSLSMNHISPELAKLRNSCIAVPGTYKFGYSIVKISLFDPSLEIYHSKQRPRFLIIYGNDGSRHRSLLKGREDVRLDQRLMQFFKLINQHVSHEFNVESRSMRIFRYSITPLTKDSGLIQFVDGADTMFSLISDYRKARMPDIFIENKLMNNIAKPNIDTLMSIQRCEVLLEVIEKTSDTDLREELWLTSPSSREWVFRSIRFVQSNSLMSIIGYILGLGDRHPSNLMIHRYTGSIIHIDFSDCFEISKNRMLFPELIPFRLTRMMLKAFGVNGIEGDFRITCEETLKMVRLHRYSIMAILDIFLQEPLELLKSNNATDSISNEQSQFEDILSPTDILSLEEFKTIDIRSSIKHIVDKIMGNGYTSIESQIDDLINCATDIYSLSHLYHGWTPLW